MKICLLTENHPRVLMGGAEYQTHLLAEELARRPGVQAHYLARRVPAADQARDLPYSVRSIGNDEGIRRRAVFFDLANLRAALDELRPDVIYEQMRQSYAAVCAEYAAKHRIPFFMHIASEWDLDTSWMPLRLSANTPFDIVESIRGAKGLRGATHVIVQTEAQGEKLKARFGMDPALLIRTFQPLPQTLAPRPPGKQRVLWVGNLKEVKRPQLYLDLARSLADEPRLEFHMVGRPWLHHSATQLMDDLKRQPNLHYHGELPIDEVNALMSSAAFYVNTSAHEGFPNTYIQAWARGAALLSLVVDPYDGMEGLGIGLLCGTVARMRDRLLELVADPQKRDAMALTAFDFAQRNHSVVEGARLADALIASAAVDQGLRATQSQ